MQPISRRAFLGSMAAAAGAAPLPQSTILVHEHILVDFIGAAGVSRTRYNHPDVIRTAVPHLNEIKRLGCIRLHECTPNFIGRDPLLLRQLSDITGLEIWTNTGLYAASNLKYLPDFAHTESAEELARRWIQEADRGVEGVKPRFIKIGVDKGPLPKISQKIVHAAAIASSYTGLTICSHTGNGAAAIEQLEIITSLGVKPNRFVWVHAQSEPSHAIHEQVGRAGAWVEFDGISHGSLEKHIDCVRFMASKNLLSRTLISHDAGWYHVGEPDGGQFRPFSTVYTEFVPMLEAGWAQELLVQNPRLAFNAF